MDIRFGECLDVLQKVANDSVDSVCTKPAFIPSLAIWQTILRVVKPGGHVVVWGDPATYHRMAIVIEDAGFELRDCIMWFYASETQQTFSPAYQPILIARKPIFQTIVDNVLQYGTGGLNIDESRIPTNGEIVVAGLSDPANRAGVVGTDWGITRVDKRRFQEAQLASLERANRMGRWPANLIHDGSMAVLNAFAEYGESKSAVGTVSSTRTKNAMMAKRKGIFNEGRTVEWEGYADKGSAARYFFCTDHDSLFKYLIKLSTPKYGVVLNPFSRDDDDFYQEFKAILIRSMNDSKSIAG